MQPGPGSQTFASRTILQRSPAYLFPALNAGGGFVWRNPSLGARLYLEFGGDGIDAYDLDE